MRSYLKFAPGDRHAGARVEALVDVLERAAANLVELEEAAVGRRVERILQYLLALARAGARAGARGGDVGGGGRFG